jgi:hypothetical protein
LETKTIPVFVVISGELEVVRPSFTQETLIRVVGPGNLTGEINTLSGRRAFTRVRARQDSKVIEIESRKSPRFGADRCGVKRNGPEPHEQIVGGGECLCSSP